MEEKRKGIITLRNRFDEGRGDGNKKGEGRRERIIMRKERKYKRINEYYYNNHLH